MPERKRKYVTDYVTGKMRDLLSPRAQNRNDRTKTLSEVYEPWRYTRNFQWLFRILSGTTGWPVISWKTNSSGLQVKFNARQWNRWTSGWPRGSYNFGDAIFCFIVNNETARNYLFSLPWLINQLFRRNARYDRYLARKKEEEKKIKKRTGKRRTFLAVLMARVSLHFLNSILAA